MGKGAWSAYWKADYDRRAEAWAKRMEEHLRPVITDEDRRMGRELVEREKMEAEAERDRKRNEYLASPINLPSRPIGARWDDDEKPKVVYVQRDPLDYPYRQPEPIYQQPDLSGVYYQRTIGGDGIGRWSIQYLNGPN